MLDIKLIRENPELVERGVKSKGLDPKIVGQFLIADKKWRVLATKLDGARAKQKKWGQAGKIAEAKKIKSTIQRFEDNLKELTRQRDRLLDKIPNLPLDQAPVGKSAADSKIVRGVGKKPVFKFKPKDHLALGEMLDIIDIKRAARLSGSRFGYLKNGAALLELALVQYAFDNLVKAGFAPIIPPVLVKPEVIREMGKGKFIDDAEAFYIGEDNFYLVGTAEYALAPLHKNETLNLKDLPKRYAGFSTCFRREAGSYGKDTKGILRVHQFDKVEQFIFCRPEDSEKELQKLVAMQEKLMRGLKLPYRVVEHCTGDMGWADAHGFDIEAWLPGENRYRETHSASNTTDFQARGLNVRFQDKNNELKFVHTLNATAFAVGRTIIAIMENYQTAKGTIKVPQVLQKYIFGLKEIK